MVLFRHVRRHWDSLSDRALPNHRLFISKSEVQASQGLMLLRNGRDHSVGTKGFQSNASYLHAGMQHWSVRSTLFIRGAELLHSIDGSIYAYWAGFEASRHVSLLSVSASRVHSARSGHWSYKLFHIPSYPSFCFDRNPEEFSIQSYI